MSEATDRVRQMGVWNEALVEAPGQDEGETVRGWLLTTR